MVLSNDLFHNRSVYSGENWSSAQNFYLLYATNQVEFVVVSTLKMIQINLGERKK